MRFENRPAGIAVAVVIEQWFDTPYSWQGIMKKKGHIQPMVCILGTNTVEASEIRHLIDDHVSEYRTEMFTDLKTLKSGLGSSACMAAILDLDSAQLNNRVVCALASDFRSVRFLSVSRDRFHPDFKDAISHHLFACLLKPVDPGELHYFLKCIHNDFITNA